MLHHPVELVFKSYMPKELEPGMWFITKKNNDTLKEYVELWALEKVPFQSLEEFVTEHGAPVEPYLILDDEVICGPEHIGWWDEGDDVDELRDIELKDINLILNEWDGYVDVEIDEYDFAKTDEINPITYNDRVVISLPNTYEY